MTATRSRSRSRRAAFTLSETLAVIAILVALAALVFPAFAGGRRGAHGSVCLGRLGSIGQATALYLADAEDRYPVLVNGFGRYAPDFRLGREKTDSPFDHPLPKEVLTPYLSDPSNLLCPEDHGREWRSVRAFPRFSLYNGATSYLFAELFGGQTGTTWRDPANAIWACDGEIAWHSPLYDPYDPKTQSVQALFYDGHTARIFNRNSPTFLE